MVRIGRVTQELDKYYTRDEVVQTCLQQISPMYHYDLVIEPSAGNGAFFQKINHAKKVGVDIAPEHKDILRADWLTYTPEEGHANILVVGNPPFGVNHAMSDAFLSRAFSLPQVTTVAFVLPNTYRKHTRQKIVPNEFRIKSITDLGRDAFTYNGALRHCPCSFFVFCKTKGKDLRVNPDTIKTNDFVFLSKYDAYDFFMFGASPGKLIKKPQSNNRGYFIKSMIGKSVLAKRLQGMQWKGNSCANGGVAWFTKLEIIQQYNKYYLTK